MSDQLYSLDELDEILRGDGRGEIVGISAIDGLIAALVAGPVTIPAVEWLPMIFGGNMPKAMPGTVEQRLVATILKHHDEVAAILERRPADYRPQFMNDRGQVVIRDWTVGFMMGMALGGDAWTPIMLSSLRQVLTPILVANELGQTCLPDFSRAKMERIRTTAHLHIADAVVALRTATAKFAATNHVSTSRQAKAAR